MLPVLKATGYNSRFGGFKRDITHVRVLGISVNIPTKAFCPLMHFLVISSETCLYVWSYWLCWVEISTWKKWLAYKSAIGNPLFLVQNECDSLSFDHKWKLMNDHHMWRVKMVKLKEIPISLLFWITGAFKGSLRGQAVRIRQSCIGIISLNIHIFPCKIPRKYLSAKADTYTSNSFTYKLYTVYKLVLSSWNDPVINTTDHPTGRQTIVSCYLTAPRPGF